jgi:AI-2 transport protein TqsA
MRLDAALRVVLGLAGIVVVVVGLRAAGGFFLPLLTALFLAVISAPVIAFLEARARMPWALAIVLTLVLDMALLAGFVALIGTSLSGLNEAIPRYHELLVVRAHELVDALARYGVHVSDEALSDLGDTRAMNVVEDVLGELAHAVSNTVLVVLLLGFVLFEARVMREKLGVLLGQASPYVEKLAYAATEVQRYLVVKTVLSVLTGVLSGCWMAACGVDFPLLWGLLTFVLNYIPSLGPAISLVPPLVISLLTMGPGGAAAVAAGHLSIGFVIGNLLEPRMMGQTLGLSTLVVFVSMFFWGWMWGPIGALYAVPLTMMLRSALESWKDTRWLAVLLGSREYVEQKRREWGWQTVEEKAEGIPAPPPQTAAPPAPATSAPPLAARKGDAPAE